MITKIESKCILIKRQPYSESSLILQVFSNRYGIINILAKGYRKNKQTPSLNILNEYDVLLSVSAQSELYVLNEITLLNEYPVDLPIQTWICAQAGMELITKLLLSSEEVPQIYELIKKYLLYLLKVKVNSIVIFWRFCMHIYKLLGIPISLYECSICRKNVSHWTVFSPESGQLVCEVCASQLVVSYNISSEASHILRILPQIGNYIEDIHISKETIKELNFFFLHYLTIHFQKKIHLNSLESLCNI